MKRLIAGAVLLVAGLARPALAQTRRAVSALQLWPEVQAELALPGNDYLFLALRGQNNTANNQLQDPGRFLGFDERRVTLGFEHFWNEHWSGGATLRYVSASKAYDVVPELLLRHRSALGPLTFGQRLSVERTFPSPTGAISQNYARLRADLEKAVPVGRFALRPRLSYQADVHVRILRTDADPTERTVQFTSLRGEIGCRLSPVVDFTPWFAYQTSYILTIEQTNGMGMVVVPAGRFNLVTPVVGLDVRFTLLQGQDGTARQQLPTQH